MSEFLHIDKGYCGKVNSELNKADEVDEFLVIEDVNFLKIEFVLHPFKNIFRGHFEIGKHYR